MSNRRRLNLDESRKARQQKKGQGPVFELGGKEYELPASPPLAALVGFAEMQQAQASGNVNLASLATAIRSLFGDNTDTVLAAGVDVDDLGEILGLYGDEGEASASGS